MAAPQRIAPAVFALILFTAACGDAGGDRWGDRSGDPSGRDGGAEPVVRDSAGVTLVDLPADRSHLPLIEPRTDHAVLLSGDFHMATGGAVLSDGWMVVGNAGSREVWYFDPSGTRQIVAGGQGEGPGEFQGINGLHRWSGDSVLVFDVGLRRHTLLGPRGEVVRTFPFAATDAVPFAQLRGVMADGTLLGTGFSQTPEGGPAAGRQRYGNPVYTFASDGQRPMVTGLESWGDAYFQLFEGGGFRVTTPPFAHGNQVLAAGSRIALASTESGEIRIHRPDGTLERILRGVGIPEAVTPTLHRAEVDRLMAGEPSSEDPAERRAFLLGIEVGTTPAMGRVHADGDGGLWIEPHRSPGQGPEGFDDWTVVDAEGIPVARARLPRGFRPLEIGAGEVLGVRADALGVEQVMRLVW